MPHGGGQGGPFRAQGRSVEFPRPGFPVFRAGPLSFSVGCPSSDSLHAQHAQAQGSMKNLCVSSRGRTRSPLANLPGRGGRHVAGRPADCAAAATCAPLVGQVLGILFCIACIATILHPHDGSRRYATRVGRWCKMVRPRLHTWHTAIRTAAMALVCICLAALRARLRNLAPWGLAPNCFRQPPLVALP